MDARTAKRGVCAANAEMLREIVESFGPRSTCSADTWRCREAYADLLDEMERRGGVVRSAVEPTEDAPALPLEHPDWSTG